MRELVRKLSPEAKQFWLAQVSQRLRANLPAAHQTLHALDYVTKPVSFKQFVEDDYYLGRVLRETLFPKLKQDLIDLFAGEYFEVVLGGAIGTGKTFASDLGILFDIYKVSCLKEPAAAFGMVPGSNLTFLNISVRQQQAEKVMFRGLGNLVKHCPYFIENFPPDPSIKSELRFPQNVTAYPVAANEASMLGEGVFSAAFDEANFFAVTEQSRLNPDGGTFDQADALYKRLSRRIRSRMNQRGRLPGHLWLVSSARYPNDFIERKKMEALNHPHIFVREYAAWETRPRSYYMPQSFRVEVGDVTKQSRILEGGEEYVDLERVIEIPMDFFQQFSVDVDGAVRDYAGISILTVRPFIPRRDMIQRAFQAAERIGIKHAFTNYTVTLQNPVEKLLPEFLHWVTSDDKDERGHSIATLAYGPYFAHIDLSKTRDATGVCICHVIGTKQIEKGIGPEKTFETRPVIRVDLVLQIVAPKGGEIQISKVRGILYQLRDIGMAFGKVTYDSWGSAESIQQLVSEGFTAETYSVDKTNDAYEETKQAFYDERIICCRHPILERELGALRIDDRKGVVDHPVPNGSKDCSDALAGAVFQATQNFMTGAASVLGDFSSPQAEDVHPQSILGLGFESEQELLDWKIENHVPLTLGEIERFK